MSDFSFRDSQFLELLGQFLGRVDDLGKYALVDGHGDRGDEGLVQSLVETGDYLF